MYKQASIGWLSHQLSGFISNKYFYFFIYCHFFVCWFVCNGQLWRPEESTNFDETWQVGSYQDLVLCFWAPLLWTPPLPSNGTLKFLKNPKKFIFSKIKNGHPGFYAHYNQPLCQKISARSVKNCMTSMQLCRDHPCRLPACLCVCLSARLQPKLLNRPFWNFQRLMSPTLRRSGIEVS